jgi:hypothetical protein
LPKSVVHTVARQLSHGTLSKNHGCASKWTVHSIE